MTPGTSVDESSGCFPESRPERLCVGTVWTLEVYVSASALRFVGGNRCSDIVDKRQSYLSLVQGAVSL